MTVIWRTPAARYTFVACALLVSACHFRIWNLTDHLRPASPVSAYIPGVLWKPRPHQPPHPQDAHEIPKQIWYKLGPRGLNDDAHDWTGTCITQNPGYHVTFLTDQSADDFIIDSFADRPDIVETFLELTVPILKADLLRYLLLYAEGGVWFDLDVSCEGIPIDDWIPEEFREDANLVVGWEFDMGYDFAFARQFTTWTVLARKGVEHLMAVVNDTVRSMGRVAEAYNVPVAGLTMDMVGDVVDFTGPRRFKRSVMKSLKRSLNKKNGWSEYHKILEPKIAGDVLILPGYALAAEANTYAGVDVDSVGPFLVTHHYAGSWKNKNGGETLDEEYEDEESQKL